MSKEITAAVLLIGDELLSGRTQDTNLKSIADFLAPLGVDVCEARVIPDVHATIVATVNHLRATYTYVFTTGGIGPTHDDITADAVAAAFGEPIDVDPRALAILEPYYKARGVEMNEGRLRMARIPAAAELILNPVSGAPGFKLGNVFVMAGVPSVMRGMLQDVGRHIETGAVVISRTVRSQVREGDISKPLAELAKATSSVTFGSYPFMRTGEAGATLFGVNLVARGRDAEDVAIAVEALCALVRAQGQTPQVDPVD